VKLSKLKQIYFVWVPNFLLSVGFFILVFPFIPVLKDEIWYISSETHRNIMSSFGNADNQLDSPFAKLLGDTNIMTEPVNKEFSIVISRLGINAPVVKDVSVINSHDYKEALKKGVAHSLTSNYPSTEPGNVYLFAHASVNLWDLGKYATVFNLLRKVELNETIHIFYEGDEYVYRVVNKEVYPGWNVYPLSRSVIEPVLTLQTCDPPGTTLNRMVVTAILDRVVKD